MVSFECYPNAIEKGPTANRAFSFSTTKSLSSCNNSLPMANPSIPDLLRSWDLTRAELSEIVAENPSMRGLMFGFVAEYKLKKKWLLRAGIADLIRPGSHDRKQKFDFGFAYKGEKVRVEVKCLDTPKVRYADGVYKGTFQCNASDSREIELPNGEKVTTNCLAWADLTCLRSPSSPLERNGNSPSP